MQLLNQRNDGDEVYADWRFGAQMFLELVVN